MPPRCSRATLLILVCLAFPATAHQGPNRVIEDLTFRIDVQGPTAALLTARANEYHVSGDLNSAAADYQGALKLAPENMAARYGLAAVALESGDWRKTCALAGEGILHADRPERQSPFHALRAQALAAQAQWTDALAAWRDALRSPHPEVDWFLGEAACLARLNRWDERAQALAQARKRNPSVVLHRTWVRALIDANQFHTARAEIDHAIGTARWTHSWRLLRARLHARTGDTALQRADAETALEEIRPRLATAKPDPYLVAEAGIALALLGNEDAARRSINRARQCGAPEVWIAEIEALLK